MERVGRDFDTAGRHGWQRHLTSRLARLSNLFEKGILGLRVGRGRSGRHTRR